MRSNRQNERRSAWRKASGFVRRCPPPGRLARIVILISFIWIGGLSAGIGTEDKTVAQFSGEEIKAGILAGFAKTTEWPPGTFKEGTRILVVGMLGRDTLGEKATVPFGTAQGGPVVQFKVVNEELEIRECHVLFIPRGEKRRARDLIDRLKTLPILTVGETDDFLDLGGMVNLVPRNGKMKYEVNLNAAKTGGLKIPAKVLATAAQVRGKYE